MDISESTELLRRLAVAPDILEGTGEAAQRAGAWRSWTFERQVWYLRKHHGITQAELSRRSGVSQRRISRIEAGEDVRMSTLRTLWRALGYEPLVIPDALDLPREPRPHRKGRKMTSTTSKPSRQGDDDLRDIIALVKRG